MFRVSDQNKSQVLLQTVPDFLMSAQGWLLSFFLGEAPISTTWALADAV